MVERLTNRTHDGHAYLVNVKDDEQEVECKSENTAQCILDSWERLAAYEDTGLTPEVCAEYRKFEDEVVASGMTFGEVVELMHKKQDGRLVVLPCKVGDIVYVITQVFNGNKIERAIGSRKIDSIGGNALNPVWVVSLQPYELHFLPSEFGKTVFLTRAEAEKALGKEQG